MGYGSNDGIYSTIQQKYRTMQGRTETQFLTEAIGSLDENFLDFSYKWNGNLKKY